MIANTVVEKDLRHYLSQHGYWPNSAEFSDLELAAIQRPGWVQVFTFEVKAKRESGEWDQLHGVCRDDERYKQFDVELFETNRERDAILADWSTGLITLSRTVQNRMQDLFLIGFWLIFTAVMVAALLAAGNVPAS